MSNPSLLIQNVFAKWNLSRWLVLSVVALTYPMAPTLSAYILLLAGAVYIAILTLSRAVRENVQIIMLCESSWIAALIYLTGGWQSIYLLLVPLLVLSISRLAGRTIAFVGIVVVTTTAFYTTNQSIDTSVLIHIFSWVAICILASTKAKNAHTSSFQLADTSKQLDTERQRLLALLNSLADAVIAVDESGRVTHYNGAALFLLNTNTNITGNNISGLLPLKDTDGHHIDLLQVAANQPGILRRADLMLATSENTAMNLDLSISPVRMSGDKRSSGNGYIMVLRDITKQRSLQQQRDEFISVASHELRTPLAIAEANLSTALLPGYAKIEPKAMHLLEQAHGNIIFLSDLIRDLTTLSRADQGALSVDLKLIRPEELVEQLLGDYRAEAENKGLEIITKVTDNPSPVLTSEYRVHEILQNFITNAIKYTPKGSVTLGASPSHDINGGVIFSVADTGIGISRADQKHLFSKFYRSEDFRTRQTGGTGLGLYITTKLAERLSAKIWFDSQLNHGSTFYLEVPPFSHLKEDTQQVAHKQVDSFMDSL